MGDLFSSQEQKNEEPAVVESAQQPKDADNLFYISSKTEGALRSILTEKQLKEAKWFFSEIRKPASKRDYYQDVDATNNRWVIDLFCKYMAKRMDPKRVGNFKKLFYDMYGIR